MGKVNITVAFLRRLFVIIEDKSGPVCLALLMIVLAIQVSGRAVGFGARLTWTDETARFLFVWSVFLSLPLASKHGALVKIKLSEKLWPASIRPFMFKLGDVLWNLTALFLAIASLINIHDHKDFPQLTPILSLNQNHLMLVIPFAFLMIFIRGQAEFWGKRHA